MVQPLPAGCRLTGIFDVSVAMFSPGSSIDTKFAAVVPFRICDG